MRSRLTSSAAVAAILASAGLAGVVSVEPVSGTNASTPQNQRADASKGQPSKAAERQSLKHVFAGGFYQSHTQRKRGPGWTHAQVQRMARKRRNVLKHKARCKGHR